VDIVLKILAGVGVALLFSLAVFIHEFGHYLAARLLGLQVDAFSIGFGPAVWKKTIGGCEYKISCIPFGGYVALPQLDPSGMEKVQGGNSENSEENEDAAEITQQLPDVAPWKRIIVSISGPLGNVVLAMFLAAVITLCPSDSVTVASTRVAYVEEDSNAYESGLRPGDYVLAINGNKVASWYDMQVEFQLSGESGSAEFEIKRNQDIKKMNLTFSTNNVLEMRLLEGVFADEQSLVGEIIKGSPAEQVDLQPEDVILSMNEIPVLGAAHFAQMIKKNGEKPVALKVLRDANKIEVVVTPKYSEELDRAVVGIRWSQKRVHVRPWMMHKGFYAQLKGDCMSVMRVLNALVVPKSEGERAAVARNVGGPVMILTMLYDSVRSGFMDSFGLLRMLCINLAILNLLPIPVLDGGHVCFAMYEVITRRKPHPKVVAGLVNVFAFILIGLMVFLMFRDVIVRRKLNNLNKTIEIREVEK